MNRRQAVQGLLGAAVGLLTTPAKAAFNSVQKWLKLPLEEMVPEGLYAKATLTIEQDDINNPPEGRDVVGIVGAWWEGHGPNALVPASPFIDKAHELVDELLEGVAIDLTRNVEIRFTFAEPFAKYNEMWEVRPEDLLQRRGFMVHRAMTCEVSRVAKEDAAQREKVRAALRSVEVLVWCQPEDG